MKQSPHPVFSTLTAFVGLGLVIWEAVGRSEDPRWILLVVYVVMMGLLSPAALERALNRFHPGPYPEDQPVTGEEGKDQSAKKEGSFQSEGDE